MIAINTFFRFVFFLFLMSMTLVTVHETAHAQFGLDLNQDASQVRSVDVTDADLRNAAEQARAQGMTMDQALELARQRGLPASEATRIRQRVVELGLNQGGSESGVSTSEESQFVTPQTFIRPQRVVTEQMRMTFGADIFQERVTEFSPAQNLATPASYTLGPGDELVVNIYGDQTDLHILTVSPEGTVDIDNLGPVFVNGLNMEEVEDRIIQSLQEIYSGLNPGSENQTTYARVSINRLRTIQVALTGDVVNPGDYAVYSNATVFNALYRAGGPDENGSYRSVRLIRGNEVIAEMDLYDYLVDGIQENNVRLRDQDVIHIPPYQNRVFIDGEVKRGGLFYEMQAGETLSDLIRYSGFFTDRAYTNRINVRRNTSTERRIIGVDEALFSTFVMQSGDEVNVDEILDRFANRVFITGAVWRSGEFELTEGMTLHDLILDAEGVRPDAFMNRGIINRLKADFTFELLNFDVSALLENPEQHDILLQREDQVQIRSLHELSDEQTVQINGAIRSSGSYTYRENMSLEDLILQSDGFTDAASEAQIEISRRIMGDAAPGQRGQQLADIFTFPVNRDLSLNGSDGAFLLEPFDLVYVHRRPDYQRQQSVSVQGQVLYPGNYTISDRNERISDLIRRSGGFTSEAYLEGARLIRKYSSIDRPNVQIDFLTNEDVVDRSELTTNGGNGGDRDSSERQSSSNGIDIEDRRMALNRQNYVGQGGGGTNSSGEGESLFAIDLESIIQNPGSSDDLFLREGDILRIPEQLQTVAVVGAVMQDVEVRYQEGMSLKRYIDQAGGFAENARESRAFVIYPNGHVDRRKQALFGLIRTSPPIEPGSQIVVPAKPPRERMNTGEVISIGATIVGMTTSLIIAIDRIAQ